MGAGVALPAEYVEFLKFTADKDPGLKK